MTDRTELLAAVLADPACDAKRLIYADWLEDHGEAERAEFIRHSIQHGMDEDGYPNMRGILGIPVEVGFVISRGFIESLSGPLSNLLAHGPAIVREHPVERVEATDYEIRKLHPSMPHSRYRVFTSNVSTIGCPELHYLLMTASYRSRESAESRCNSAVLAELRRRVDDSSTQNDGIDKEGG